MKILPDWPYEAKYVEIDGLRRAYVDEGHRVIAMDHLGMGRSDKPIDVGYHSYLYVVGTNPDFFSRVVVGNGVLPVFAEGEIRYPLPEDEEAAPDAMKRSIRMIPARQPEFYDSAGNFRFGGTEDSGYFGLRICHILTY